MRHRRYARFIVLPLLAAMLACGRAGPPTPSTSARATGLAQTAAALLTSTAAARATLATPAPLPTSTPPSLATATPPPSATLAPAPDTPSAASSPTPCVNDSAFVSDVTVPDGTHFAPGASFIKTWRLRNDGDCTWTTAYTFRHVAGDGLSGASLNLPNDVPAGGTVDLPVSLMAPGSNGTFTGQWQLYSPDGAAFGTKPFVEIIVP